MQYTLKFTIFTLLCGLLAMTNGASLPNHIVDKTLLKLMLNSRALTEANPARSMDCFNYYNPQLDAITKQHELDYTKCVEAASNDREYVNKYTQQDREDIDFSAQSSCKALQTCAGTKDAIEYFDCYAQAGSDNSKTMYTISTNATEIVVNLREKYRLIDNEETRCTGAAERAYIENTSATFEQLQSCLQGKSTVPPPAKETSTIGPVIPESE